MSITDYVIDILLILFILRQVRPHELTGAGVWTTGLVVMAFGQVIARLAVLQVRRVRGGRLVKIRPASRMARA